MPLDLTLFETTLNSTFSQIESTQAEALNTQIASNFVAGRTAGEKHKSTLPSNKLNFEPVKSAEDQEEEEEGLTTEEKAEIAILVALFLGYVHEFNSRTKTQILTEVSAMVTAGKTQEEIKNYVQNVFEGKENIVIDNVGKVRKEIYVDKNLKISEVEKVITRKYYTSVQNYSQLMGEQASHAAYEKGREMYNISQGIDMWVFSGPVDERARPWHIALVGTTYQWNSEQSRYAEQCLSEPRCRHRAMPYYGDSRDVPQEKWDKLKEDVGLYWDEDKKEWAIK